MEDYFTPAGLLKFMTANLKSVLDYESLSGLVSFREMMMMKLWIYKNHIYELNQFNDLLPVGS